MKRFKSADQILGAVIGYSPAFNMGKAHLNEMKHAGMVPTAVADINEKVLEAARADFPGIETYTSVTDMLRRSPANMVAIITPHNTHTQLAVQCLKAGRHVVCEKPLAITTAECDRMIAVARQKKRVLSTYHNRHWNGCIMNAVSRIGAGQIGEVVGVAAHMCHYGKPGNWWRSSKSISGGVLYDWGVHLLEYSLQILQSDIKEVSGFAHSGHWAPQTAWKKDTNEDEGLVAVRFANGKYLTLRISSIEAVPPRGWLEITGTKGTYVFDYSTFEIHRVVNGETVVTKGRNPDGQESQFYQNIADHLVKGTPLVITPEWARRPIHILDLADRSARQNRSLAAKYR